MNLLRKVNHASRKIEALCVKILIMLLFHVPIFKRSVRVSNVRLIDLSLFLYSLTEMPVSFLN